MSDDGSSQRTALPRTIRLAGRQAGRWQVVAALVCVLTLGGPGTRELIAEEMAVDDLETRLADASGRERVEILNKLAIHYHSRSAEAARRQAKQAAELARAIRDRRGEGIARKVLAVVESVAGNHRQALEINGQALAIFEETDDLVEQGKVLNNAGIFHRMLGELDQAIAFYRRSLAIEKRLGNQKGIGRTLGNIANVHFDRGDYRKALEIHLQELEVVQGLGDQGEIASALSSIGVAHYELGGYEQALRYQLEALAINEASGDTLSERVSLLNIGNVYRRAGKPEKALDSFARALALAEEIGESHGISGALNAIGAIQLSEGDFDNARRTLERALSVLETSGEPAGVADALTQLGACQRATGDMQGALSYLRRVLALRQEIGDQPGVAEAFNGIGSILTELGQYDEGRSHLSRGLEIAEPLGALETAKESHWQLYLNASGRGDHVGAVGHLRDHMDVKDALLDQRTADRLAELEIQYEASAREREIAILEQENEIRRLEASRARWRADALLALLMLVLLVSGWLSYRYRHLLAFWKRHSYVGQYRLTEKIATGGMGVVYRAQKVAGGSRIFAVKVIREEQASDAVVRKRFLREAALVDQLDHPHIVSVHERGEHDGRPFIAMELLEGPSLAQLIEAGDRLPLVDCLHIFRQLCGVVQAIHRKAVLHRDLKPENVVLVTRNGDARFVKLLDFGLARTLPLTRLTRTGQLIGTLDYLPPEQIVGRELTCASDVYSLGVLFYETLTLAKPFFGATPPDILKRILDDTPMEPARLRPEIPPGLNRLVLAMLAREPEARPGDDAILLQLSDLADSRGDGDGAAPV